MVKLVAVQDKISVLQPACFHLDEDLLLLLWSKFLVFKYTNTNQTNQRTTFKICLFRKRSANHRRIIAPKETYNRISMKKILLKLVKFQDIIRHPNVFKMVFETHKKKYKKRISCFAQPCETLVFPRHFYCESDLYMKIPIKPVDLHD